jgi:membrane protein DedA with SNARE-associated domain
LPSRPWEAPSLFDALLDRLLGLPDWLVYVLVGAGAAVENIFPPIPADTAAAIGAFLSQHGTINAAAIFAVTWSANVGGAVAVYVAGRTLGRQFFTGRIGRRLLKPKPMRRMERLYQRYGSRGIFLSRFVPGVRAVVPAFAGIAGLGAWRALIPMAVASAIWYGALVFVVARLAHQIEDVARILTGFNWTILVLAVLFVAFVVWVVVVGRRYWHTAEHPTHKEQD